MAQLISLLASNPNLRRVSLVQHTVADDSVDRTSSRVQLRHLESLDLKGDSRNVMKLFHRLDYPGNMENLGLDLCNCDITDIPQIIGPYLQDHLQHRDKFQDGVSVDVDVYERGSGNSIALHLRDDDRTNLSGPTSGWMVYRIVALDMELNARHPKDVLNEATLDLLARIPREDVNKFHTDYGFDAMEGVYTRFPNLRELHTSKIPLSKVFPNQILDRETTIPPLERVVLQNMVVDGGDWSPLTTFLAHRVSFGNRLETLVIHYPPDMSPELEDSIKAAVGELIVTR